MDVVLMFKILILQRLYNISDEQVEYQTNDPQSFQRFLGLHMGGAVPDYTSVWRFREQLAAGGTAKKLFELYVEKLEGQGVITKQGRIVDASLVEVPRQRNSRKENEMIKEGKVPPECRKQPRKLTQKDTQARWAQKNGQNYFGCKDHDLGDAASKLVRDYEVTPASTHDSQVDLMNEKHAGESLFADSAYKSRERDERLAALGINNYVHERPARNRALDEVQKKSNRIKSRVRVRI